MTINELVGFLLKGLRKTLRDIHDFSEDLDAEIYPEYLKTIAIARVLKDAVGSSAWVRLEQATSYTLGTSVLPGHRPPGFSTLVSRSGELDIVLGVEENGWRYPVVLIENKRYAAGYSTIEDDAVRCAEFVAAQGVTGSIEMAAVTYFRRETQGVILSHQVKAGERALDRINALAAMLAAQLKVDHCHKRVRLESTAFADRDEALSDDKDGMPAYVSRPTYTIWGAVELFYRTTTQPRFSRLP